MWGLSGRFSYDSTWVAHLRSYDMDVTLEVNFLEYVMTRQSCCSFVVTQQCFSNFNHVMIQALLWHDSVFQISIMSWYRLCCDTTVFFRFQFCHDTGFVVTRQCFSDFVHVMDTGLAVTQQCFQNFNRVMIQALLWHGTPVFLFGKSHHVWVGLNMNVMVFSIFELPVG